MRKLFAIIALSLLSVSSFAQQAIYGDLERGVYNAGVPTFLLEGSNTLPICQSTLAAEDNANDVTPGGTVLLTAIDNTNRPGWYRCTDSGWIPVTLVRRLASLPDGADSFLQTVIILPDGTLNYLERRNIPSTAAVPAPNWQNFTTTVATNNGFTNYVGTYNYPVQFRHDTGAGANSIAFIYSQGVFYQKVVASGITTVVELTDSELSSFLPSGWTFIGNFEVQQQATDSLVLGINLAHWAFQTTGSTRIYFSASITTAPVPGRNEYHWHRIASEADLVSVISGLAPTATQAEAEAGTSTEVRSWTPQRIAQAIASLASGGGTGITADDAADEVGADLAALSEFTYNSITNTYTFTQTQSDWTETDTSNDAFINNKPTIPTLTPGANILPTSCIAAQIPKRNAGNTAWICAADDVGSGGTGITADQAADEVGADLAELSAFTYNATTNTYTFTETQSDWSQASTTAASFIHNKPTIPNLSPGSNILPSACTADQIAKRNTGNTAWICATDDTGSGSGTTNLGIGTRTDTEVPITSSSGTDATFPAATTSLAGALTGTDKTKLDGIATGAEVNVQANWSTTDTSNDSFIHNKPTIPEVAREFARTSPVTFATSGPHTLVPTAINNGRIWNYTGASNSTVNYSDAGTALGVWRAMIAHSGTGGTVTVQGGGTQIATLAAGESGLAIWVPSSWGFVFVGRNPPTATSTSAGLMSAADKAKLDTLGTSTTDNNVHIWASTSQTVTALDSAAVEGWPTVTLATPSANSFLIVAQMSTDDDITSMEKDGINQFGTLSKSATTFTDSGETFEFWFTTTGPLFPSALAGTYTFRR